MNIISNLLEIMNKQGSLLEIEEQIMHVFSTYFTESVSQALETIDQQLVARYMEDNWKIDSRKPRTLTFLFGDVTFKHYRLCKPGEPSFCPLDQALGIEKRSKFSPLIKERVVTAATHTTYRNASEIVNDIGAFHVSASCIQKWVVALGDKVQEAEKQALEADDVHRKKEVPYLFIEGDGVRLSGQKANRTQNSPKKPKLEMHRVMVYEGIDRSKKRPETVGCRIFTSMVNSQKALDQATLYIDKHYKLKETHVIANSDNGIGYQEGQFKEIAPLAKSFDYCVDRYHVHRKIKERLGFDRGLQKQILKAVNSYDWERIKVLLDTKESQWLVLEEDENKDFRHQAQNNVKQIQKLSAYLERNWSAIESLEHRGYGNITVGVCESGHRVFTYRMKHQGRSWTKHGASCMIAIITSVHSGRLREYLTRNYTECPVDSLVNMSAAKALLKSKQTRPSIGVHFGRIPNNGSSSSPMGRLVKQLRS